MFRSIGAAALAIERMHIVVDSDEGDEVTELEEVNSVLQAVSEARKVIRDGVLYIERESVICDATGQRVE